MQHHYIAARSWIIIIISAYTTQWLLNYCQANYIPKFKAAAGWWFIRKKRISFKFEYIKTRPTNLHIRHLLYFLFPPLTGRITRSSSSVYKYNKPKNLMSDLFFSLSLGGNNTKEHHITTWETQRGWFPSLFITTSPELFSKSTGKKMQNLVTALDIGTVSNIITTTPVGQSCPGYN